MSNSDLLDLVSSISAARVSNVVLSRVEGQTFSKVRLNSHPESLRQFDSVICSEEARQKVKDIHYDVILPSVSEKRLENKFQSSNEASENTLAFISAILSLFTRLSSWNARGIALRLTATSPSDDTALRVVSRSVCIKSKRNHFKYIGLDLHLHLTGRFPLVRCVSSSDFERLDSNSTNPSGRRVYPDLIASMSVSLPALKSISWEFYMPPRRMVSRRQEFWVALGRALALPEFSHLACARITLYDRDPRNEGADLHSLVVGSRDATVDLAIQKICTLPTLTTLHLCGNWSLSSIAFAKGFGLRVNSVYIDLSSVTPDGRWLFDPIPPLSDEENFNDDDLASDSEHEVLHDFDSADSDSIDFLGEKAEDIANFELPVREIHGEPSAHAFGPLAIALANAVIQSSSCLGRLEVHLLGSLSQVHLGYFNPDTEEVYKPRGANFWSIWSRPKVRARFEAGAATWHISVQGDVAYIGWKVPAGLRKAMENGVGAGNVFAYSHAKDLEME
ncbi:uncharacterized protein JN550_009745 [Neoarthrinium moseri]|uniref:uncharacterized protein n=1 Tax=Neoarthrinium moseri TaxID=1658444 RepID=UPI001FDAD590|nr:uncharacterized protein JN550_009745 [Neoarthrinium moseri]KAI1863219.1 hypothetical protein JN550_009745 [Neoarthrinium moseri]